MRAGLFLSSADRVFQPNAPVRSAGQKLKDLNDVMATAQSKQYTSVQAFETDLISVYVSMFLSIISEHTQSHHAHKCIRLLVFIMGL